MAQAVSDICPREKKFCDLIKFCAAEITNFVGDSKEYATVLFGDLGTAAMVEAILNSVVPDDGRILIIDNGTYGIRMCQITSIFNKNIQDIAGIGFAICYKKALKDIKEIPSRSLYLNLMLSMRI